MTDAQRVNEERWGALERALLTMGLPVETADEFMWMSATSHVNAYKHRDTRVYLHLAVEGETVGAQQAIESARGWK